MASTVRACPSCKTTLPPDAIFCHKCGMSTPMEINAATGEIHAPALSGLEEQARRAKLQAAVGDTVEIRRLLGRGGFAEVYVAYDRRLKREIAVKTIRGDLVVNENLLQRFQREAEAVAKLRHPHVIPIYSVGEANGVAYFTMPLIEGESLADLLTRDGRLSVAEACRILREAANALHAAHRTGLVHRDIKPENIMLEGPERTAVVMDFGIAKSEGADAKGLTGTGMLVGTPQYMSPEQATGERELDARSDQYSLAMVGYRMLTGRFPFTGDTVQQLIFKTVTEVPVPASDLSSDVPQELSAVLAKALSKAPGDRYESMAAFAAAVAATDRTGAGAAVGRGFRRTTPDMPTRIRSALQSMPRWSHPLVLAGIVAAIVSVGANFTLQSDVGTSVAAGRADAVFAAKAFLASKIGPVTTGAFPTFVKRDHQIEYLHRHIGVDSTERRGATDVPLWLWTVKFGAMADGRWQVDVGPQNRILGFTHMIRDTAALPDISHDSARALAESEIRARGWSPEALTLVTDSTVKRRKRTDHVFRWRQIADPVPSEKGDTAYVQVTSTVRGNHVADYAVNLRLPDSHDAEHDSSVLRRVLNGVGWIGAVILCAFAFGYAVTRQRVDQLQWGAVARLLAVSGAAFLILGIPALVRNLAIAQESSAYVEALIVIPLSFATLGALILFIGVAGESLAAEQRPSMVEGLEDVSRGRLMIPEVMSGVMWGFVIGFIGAGTIDALRLLAARFVGPRAAGAGSVTEMFDMALPSGYALLAIGPAIPMSLLLLYAIAFFNRKRLTSRVALVLPALMVTAMFFSSTAMTSVWSGLQVLFVSYALWRFGIIAAFIAFWAPDLIKAASVLIASGGGELLLAGLVTLALALAPLVLAFMLARRYQKAT